MGWFAGLRQTETDSTGPSDYQKVFAKLAQVQMEIQEAERSLHQISLAAALGGDENAGADVLARLTELRSREELLSSALKQAEEQERANQGRLGAREHEARKRSLSQKAGQLKRDQQRFTAAALEYRDSYRAMVQTAASIAALLPSNLRDSYEGMLSQGAIKKLCEVETYRISMDGIPAPGIDRKRLYADEIPSLADTIEQRISNLKEGLEQAGPILAAPSRPILMSAPEPQPTDYSVDSAVWAAAVEPRGPTPPASIALTEATAVLHIHCRRVSVWLCPQQSTQSSRR